MKNKSLLVVAVFIVIGILIFLVIKISSKNNKPQEATQIAAAQNSSGTISLGQQAPTFSLTTLDGPAFRLSENKGKTVILFGMAGWCGTCIPEGRALTQIKKDYAGKGVEIIGVAFTEGDNDEFLKEYKKIGDIDIPIALDTDDVASKYQLTKLETTYIINKDGVIVYKDEQMTSYEDYKKELDKII